MLLWWWGHQVIWPDLSESDSGAVNSTPSYPPGMCTDPRTHIHVYTLSNIHTHRLTHSHTQLPTHGFYTNQPALPPHQRPVQCTTLRQHIRVRRLTGPHRAPHTAVPSASKPPKFPTPAGLRLSSLGCRRHSHQHGLPVETGLGSNSVLGFSILENSGVSHRQSSLAVLICKGPGWYFSEGCGDIK